MAQAGSQKDLCKPRPSLPGLCWLRFRQVSHSIRWYCKLVICQYESILSIRIGFRQVSHSIRWYYNLVVTQSKSILIITKYVLDRWAITLAGIAILHSVQNHLNHHKICFRQVGHFIDWYCKLAVTQYESILTITKYIEGRLYHDLNLQGQGLCLQSQMGHRYLPRWFRMKSNKDFKLTDKN